MYNKKTGEIKNQTGYSLDQTTINSAIQECRANGTCGEGVNDYLQKLGDKRVFGDAYSQKQSMINSNTPTVGSIAIWNPSETSGKNYGHVAVVLQDN